MPVLSTIKKSELEGGQRIDAEYYQPEYLKVSKTLSDSSALKNMSTKITDFGAYSQMNFVEFVDSGVRFLRNQDVSDFFMDDSDPIYITEKMYQKLSLKLEKFDIIIPRVGTLGNSAIIFEKNLPATANQNLAQIKANQTKIDPIYLSVFLCSRYGKAQFKRAATGNVQPWLNLQQIQNLKVYLASPSQQKSVRRLALKALEEHKSSFKFYNEAEQLLLNELEIQESDFEDELSYSVSLSETEERADAEYYQPKYKKLIEKIHNKNSKKLDHLVSLKKGKEPGSNAYQEEGKLFIRVSSLSKFGIKNDDQKYLSEELYNKLQKDYEPKVGEILLTKDATPGITYVLREPIEGVISGGILRLILKNKDINAEYLALCINSFVGQMQTERDAGGSIIKHWKPDQIKNLSIPILSKTLQDRIGELVQKSHEARKKSKQLLEDAKTQVEQLIENNTTNQ